MKKTNKQKPLSKSERILALCKLLQIETFSDLQTFKQKVQQDGETLPAALERYFNEVFDD